MVFMSSLQTGNMEAFGFNMINNDTTILIVDDEIFNLEILTEHLTNEGYGVASAENGEEAWDLLQENPGCFDAILLDRMMPIMDGMEVLNKIKATQELRMIPVVMQTAKAAKEDVLEGLQAGAYYYLTKPFDKSTMLAIIKTAVSDYKKYVALQHKTIQVDDTLSLMSCGEFHFQTISEAYSLAKLLANIRPQTTKAAIGLSELLINAVEHGNLGITYEDKSKLQDIDEWMQEINRRLALPENIKKQASVRFEYKNDEVHFIITDQGDGFNPSSFMEISPERAFDTHGRGIAMAKILSFDRIEYLGSGNQVRAVVLHQN